MQSVCSVLPGEQWQQVVDARALASGDPALGAIYDPPFVHFTHQLAEEYDWEGLSEALASFAKQHEPLEARTTGLHVFSGVDVGLTVAVYRSVELIEYHEALWETVRPFAQGRLRAVDEPLTWLPHITIKRCSKHYESFGRLMSQLAQRSFAWTFTIDNVSVQCDPGRDSRTHYQRLFYHLGDAIAGRPREAVTNASILEVLQSDESAPEPTWRFSLKPDEGAPRIVAVSSPELVRLMAECRCSEVHFAGGRCRMEDGRIVAVVPNAPFPVVG